MDGQLWHKLALGGFGAETASSREAAAVNPGLQPFLDSSDRAQIVCRVAKQGKLLEFSKCHLAFLVVFRAGLHPEAEQGSGLCWASDLSPWHPLLRMNWTFTPLPVSTGRPLKRSTSNPLLQPPPKRTTLGAAPAVAAAQQPGGG